MKNLSLSPYGSREQGCQVKKVKKAKFGYKQFQKGQILKSEKRPNKGQFFDEILVK